MNIVKIIKKREIVYGIITEIEQLILFLLILNLFKCKRSITENTYNIGDGEDGYYQIKVGRKKIELVIPVKYLSDFWRS